MSSCPAAVQIMPAAGTAQNKHGLHACYIRILASLVDNDGRQFTSIDGKHGDGIQDKDKHLGSCCIGRETVYIRNVGRCPEQIEPPNAVGHEFTEEYSPRLRKLEALKERYLLIVEVAVCALCLGFVCFRIVVVLFDVCQFGCIDMRIGMRLLVEEHPQSHPDEAQSTDNDECHFPSVAYTDTLEVACQRRYADRGNQSSDSRACIEDGS